MLTNNSGAPGRIRGIPWYVAAQNVEHHRLRNVISIVARGHLVCRQALCSAVQRLPPEHAAKRAIATCANLRDYFIHRPSVQLLVRHDFERDAILLLVPLDGLETVIAIPGDALVD